MQRWNWFLSADIRGKWITTHGYAEVELGVATFDALLRFSPDTEPYHHIAATVDAEDCVDAVVDSPGRDLAAFRLQGSIFRGAVDDGVGTMTILLTDGTTVLGLAYGPCSHEDNL